VALLARALRACSCRDESRHQRSAVMATNRADALEPASGGAALRRRRQGSDVARYHRSKAAYHARTVETSRRLLHVDMERTNLILRPEEAPPRTVN
jgi:hypothetical protein